MADKTKRHPKAREWLFSPPLAHRGLHDHDAGVPENSMTAFAAALDMGYGVELDVRLAGDGAAVVFHDDDLFRMTGERGLMADAGAEVVRSLRLLDTDEYPPLLEEVLDLVRGAGPVYVEVKNQGRPGALESRVASLVSAYAGPICVASFNPMVVGWFARNAPGLCRGIIAGCQRDVGSGRRRLRDGLHFNALTRPDFVSYCLAGLPCPPVTRWRSRGGAVLAWTVRSGEDVAKAGLYADNHIFEGCLPDAGCGDDPGPVPDPG
jgi:glycerophosphoryl diester phosphodiesterase